MGKRGPPSTRIERTCEWCGELFTAKQRVVDEGGGRFCSHQCSGSFRSSLTTIALFCQYCGKEFHIARSHASQKCCSIECSQAASRKRIEVNCAYCGKLLSVHPSSLADSGHKFCSQECHYSYVREQIRGAATPHWRGGPVTLICLECGNEFKVSRGRTGTAKFCSVKCRILYCRGANASQWRGANVEAICLHCGGTYIGRKYRIESGVTKFCSDECRKAHTRGTAHHSWKGGPTSESTCDWCGRIYSADGSRVRNGHSKYCSLACAGAANGASHTGDRSPAWKGGPIAVECQQCGKPFRTTNYFFSRGQGRFCSRRCAGDYVYENTPHLPKKYPCGWNHSFKESVRQRDGYICALCGGVDNDVALSVHHIDYNRDNLDPTNLISLCRSCHTKTNGKRYLWEPLLRDMLLERYSDIMREAA